MTDPWRTGGLRFVARGKDGDGRPESVRVDKGIPFPDTGRTGQQRSHYPWRAMEVGDSFEFAGSIRRAQSIAAHYSRGCKSRPPMNFKARVLDGVVRIWRLPHEREGS